MKISRIIMPLAIVLLSTINANSQTLNPTFTIDTPGMADTFKGGYTFSYSKAGTPWNGALISYGGAVNNYDCQISSDYGLNRISFRTRNGDHGGSWNQWNELVTTLGDNNLFGTLSVGAYQSTSPFSVGNNHGIKLSIGNSAWQNTSVIETGYTVETGDFTDIKAASYGYSIGLIRVFRDGNVRMNGGILVRNLPNSNNSSAIMVSHSIPDGNDVTFGTSVRSITESGSSNIYGMQFFTQASYLTGQTEKLRIQGNGNVGIGTTNPDSKLTVAGNIHAQEVKVTVNAGAVPDYVFTSDYKLKSLQEVEKYIKQNNHLPEIPSAEEIEKNGLMLAEMNMNLLKKIEEMTLYMIEMKKEIQGQNTKILNLEEKLKEKI